MVDGEEYVDQRTNVNSWKNYGDTSPREHGGWFLNWKGSYWRLVKTRDLEGHSMLEGSDDRYMFKSYKIYPSDVWVDGDPEKGFTQGMKDIVETFNNQDFDPMDVEEVEYLIPDLPFHSGMRERETYAANYWKHLEGNWGITASKFA
jgi:hypothetical protein